MIAGSSSMMIRTSSVSAAKIPMPATSLPSVTGHTTGEGSVRVQRHGPTAVLPDDRTALCLERLRRSFQQYQGISPRLRESAVHLLIGDHRKFAVIHYQAPIESADCLADVLASPTLHSAGRQMIRAVSVWWPGGSVDGWMTIGVKVTPACLVFTIISPQL